MLPTEVVLVSGTSASLAGVPGAGVTLNEVLAPISPVALTLMLAAPVVEAVKLEVAMPLAALTGEGGLKVPATPLSAKLTALVALLTVLPLASWMSTTYSIATPLCTLAFTGASANFAGGPITGVTLKVASALVRPAAETLMVPVPAVLGVKLAVAVPPLALTGVAGSNAPAMPVTPKLIALVALVTVLPLASWMVAV